MQVRVGGVSGTFADWLQEKIKRFECDKKHRIAMRCWAIWKAQNDLVWNNKGTSVDSVVYLAISSLEQWTRAGYQYNSNGSILDRRGQQC